MSLSRNNFVESFFIKELTFPQLPCSALDASIGMEQTISQFAMQENTRNKLMIPQRLNQEHKLEEYSIDVCSEDQKEVLSYILQYLKRWEELEKTPESIKTFKPLRMTLCGV